MGRGSIRRARAGHGKRGRDRGARRSSRRSASGSTPGSFWVVGLDGGVSDGFPSTDRKRERELDLERDDDHDGDGLDGFTLGEAT